MLRIDCQRRRPRGVRSGSMAHRRFTLTQSEIVDDYLAPILLSLPEDIALYRKYVGATIAAELPVGVVGVPKVK